MEFDLIDMIRTRTQVARADVRCGIGDDAALLTPPPDQELAVALDTLVAGVHFLPDTDPRDLGWKALAVNLSDLAAMGATPAWALVGLTLPRADAEFVAGFATGFGELAKRYNLALVGGDTTQGPLTISVTVHGFVPRGQGLLRAGAQVGDNIYVTGDLGDAAAALQCLDEPTVGARSMRAHLERPEPRVAAGLALRGLAHSAIDISDGLLADLGHICQASGVSAHVEADAIPQSEALRARFAAEAARALALTGGDAYELCFTAAPADHAGVVAAMEGAGCRAVRIGRIERGSGVHVVDGTGTALHFGRAGWEHFRT